MVDDIERQLTLKHYPIKYVTTEIELQDLLLQHLEEIFSRNGQQITNYNLPCRCIHHELGTSNKLIQEEMNYDIQYLEEESKKLYSQITTK